MSGLTLGMTLFCWGSGEGLDSAFVSTGSTLESVGAEGDGDATAAELDGSAGVETVASVAETQLARETMTGQFFRPRGHVEKGNKDKKRTMRRQLLGSGIQNRQKDCSCRKPLGAHHLLLR